MPTINVNVSVISTIAGTPYGQSNSTSPTTNGVDSIQQTLAVTTGSWTNLGFGGLPNERYIAIQNLPASVNVSASTIIIATGSAGGYPIGYLQTGDLAVYPWSGSMGGLYASVTSSSLSPMASVSYTAFQA